MNSKARFQALASIKDGKVFLERCLNPQFCARLLERDYLDLKTKEIDPFEAALWASRNQLSIEGKGDWDAVVDLVLKTNLSLKILIAYLALRRKYPKVYKWSREDTLIAYGNREEKKLEVLVLEEGEEILIENIISWSIAAVKDNHDPIIAIVDRNGSVTFYEARVVTELV